MMERREDSKGRDPLEEWVRVISEAPTRQDASGSDATGQPAPDPVGRSKTRSPGIASAPLLGRRWIVGTMAVLLMCAAFLALHWFLERRNVRQVETSAVESIRWGAMATTLHRSAGVVEFPKSAALDGPPGRVVLLIHVKEGDHVRAGDPLITFDSERISRDVRLAHEAYLASVQDSIRIHRDWIAGSALPKELEQARLDVSAQRTRWRQLQSDLQDHVLRAPIDARVFEIRAEAGERPSGPCIELVDDSFAWVLTDIDEMDLSKVLEGRPAVVVLDSEPMTEYAARVEGFAQMADPASHTLEARVRVEKPGSSMRKGLSAIVHFTELPAIGHGPSVMMVAVDSGFVHHALAWTIEGGRARVREIRLGERLGRWLRVEEGLQPGDVVIRAADGGAFTEGERVRVRN